MQELQEVIQAANASRKYSLAVLIFVVLFAFLSPIFSFLFSVSQATGVIVLGCLMLILEGLLVIPCLGLARQGRTAFSTPVMWTGIFIIVGGIWFDVLATAWKTPDMGIEGNPFIIFMRQNGFPLWSMYLVGFYAQATLSLISVLLWVAFMRHWRTYLDVLLALQPQSFLEYLKAALGGNTWYAKINHIRVSRSYRFLWLPILLRIAPFDRWELGLEWVGVLPPSTFYRQMVSWGQVVGIFLLFLFGLVTFYYKKRGQIQRFDGNFLRASYLNLLRSVLIGSGILICGCCGLTAVFVPSVAYLTRPPDNLQVTLKQSETAQVNQLFFIELELANKGSVPLTVSQVFLDSPGLPGIMESLSFVSSDPPAALQTLNGTRYLFIGHTLVPGETKRLTFYFVPLLPGEFTGVISVLSRERILALDVNLHVSEP
jgi:hypothetical protein